MNSDMKNSQDDLDSCRWTQMSFHIHPGPTRVYSRSPTPLLSTVQVTGSVSLEQPTQLSVQRAVGAMGQGSWVTTSQTALSSAPWPLHWLPCERGAPVLWGQLRFLSPSRGGTQVPGHTFLSLPQCLTISSRVTDASNSWQPCSGAAHSFNLFY